MAKYVLMIFAMILMTQVFGQFKPKGTYIGVEEMKGYSDPAKAKYKWYHLSEITIKDDSIYLEQSPVAIYKKDTIFSASDGGFYSYAGTLKELKGKTVAALTLISCNYCHLQMVRFTPPKIIDDNDTTQNAEMDTTSIVEEPKAIENMKLKYKTLFLQKANNNNTLFVNKVVYKRKD